MRAALDNPFVVLLGSLVVFSASAWIGTRLRHLLRIGESDWENFSFVLGGTLTLLGLIVGFTFSMAVGRYDQRKGREEQRLTRSGRHMGRRTSCLPRMPPGCVVCSAPTSISEFSSTR